MEQPFHSRISSGVRVHIVVACILVLVLLLLCGSLFIAKIT
jgi:hypothetical protein